MRQEMMGFGMAVASTGPYANNLYAYTSFPTDNHANTSSLKFYTPDALLDAQPTVSKHPRHYTALISDKFVTAIICVHGRCGGIWRESIAFSQFSFDSILPFLAGVQEETFVVSGGLLKPAAQRTREALRGAEIRNEAGPKAAGRHAGLDGRTGKQKVCHLPPPPAVTTLWVTVLDKLFTPIVPRFTKQRNW